MLESSTLVRWVARQIWKLLSLEIAIHRKDCSCREERVSDLAVLKHRCVSQVTGPWWDDFPWAEFDKLFRRYLTITDLHAIVLQFYVNHRFAIITCNMRLDMDIVLKVSNEEGVSLCNGNADASIRGNVCSGWGRDLSNVLYADDCGCTLD